MPLWFGKMLLRNNLMPVQFEFIEEWEFTDLPGIPKYVTILDKFEHHYSHEIMYHVRIEFIVGIFKQARVEYKTVTEPELLDMLKRKV